MQMIGGTINPPAAPTFDEPRSVDSRDGRPSEHGDGDAEDADGRADGLELARAAESASGTGGAESTPGTVESAAHSEEGDVPLFTGVGAKSASLSGSRLGRKKGNPSMSRSAAGASASRSATGKNRKKKGDDKKGKKKGDDDDAAKDGAGCQCHCVVQ